eukprot:c16387_g1_i2 orf=226-1389(+)
MSRHILRQALSIRRDFSIAFEAQKIALSRSMKRCSSSHCKGDDEISTVANTVTGLNQGRSDLNEDIFTVLYSDGGSCFCPSFTARRMSHEFKSIHATAVVHHDARIGEDVHIGPFCTVGAGVRLGNGCVLHPSSHIFGNTELGERCVVHTGAVVGSDIPGFSVIGKENSIGCYAVVGAKCQDMKYKEGDDCFLYMGNNNDVREFVSIHRSSKSDDQTVIGDENLIMGFCHVAHDCKLGSRNILANNTLLGGHVIIQDFVHTGGAVAVHQFCHIDSYSFLAGGSMVAQDVPMYMMVAGDRAELRGVNLEGLRRHGFSEVEVTGIRLVYQKLFMNTDPEAGGLEERLVELESNDELVKVTAVAVMLKSVRNCFGEKRRGICKFRHWACV